MTGEDNLKRDRLTGALSHLVLASRVRPGLLAVLVDIDGLIWVNDERGHVAGDDVLARVATALSPLAPEEIFRIGGDEFLLVLHEDVDDALDVARRAVEAVRSLRIPFEGKLQPWRAQVEVNATVIQLSERILHEGVGAKGVTLAFRDWFAGLTFNAKTRQPDAVGLVIDAHGERWDG